MSSLKQTGDDDYEIGPPSLVNDEDGTLPEPDTKEGANFWGYMTGIWSTIERKMNNLYTYVFAQNDVFDENDDNNISDAETDTIIADYQAIVNNELGHWDDDTDCLLGMEITSSKTIKAASQGASKAASQGDSQGASFSQLTAATAPDSPSTTTYVDTEKGRGTGESAATDVSALSNRATSSAENSPKYRSVFEMGAFDEAGSSPPAEEADDEYSTGSTNTLQSGTSSTRNIKSSSIKNIIDEIKKDAEDESQPAQLVLLTVATTNLSKLLNIDVEKALSSGNASMLYKAIAKILYNKQPVAIDVRDAAARGKSNEGQMRDVWGSRITDFAKSADATCYLCGGQIVPSFPGGGRPEMEHKLPCAVFYAKFAFIYTCFANELGKWRDYVADLDENSNLMQYYNAMNSRVAPFNKDQLDGMYATISTGFLTKLGSPDLDKPDEQLSIDDKTLKLFINIVLPAYLSEFAYSHHLCNQLKSNYDLSDATKLDNYYKALVVMVNKNGKECNIEAGRAILNPACPKGRVCNAERGAIIAGLKGVGVLDLRKNNVKAQMVTLNTYARLYATQAKKTQKRMILHTITETIKVMQIPIASDKNITIRAAKQMNIQAKEVSAGLATNIKKAREFLQTIPGLTGGRSGRLKQFNEDKLRLYLDRTYQIFEDGIDIPNSITSQLKNTYIYPYLKIQIYDRTQDYITELHKILTQLYTSITNINLDVALPQDDIDKLTECKIFVLTYLRENIIVKYAVKINELKGIEAARQDALKSSSSFISVKPPPRISGAAATLLQQIKAKNENQQQASTTTGKKKYSATSRGQTTAAGTSKSDFKPGGGEYNMSIADSMKARGLTNTGKQRYATHAEVDDLEEFSATLLDPTKYVGTSGSGFKPGEGKELTNFITKSAAPRRPLGRYLNPGGVVSVRGTTDASQAPIRGNLFSPVNVPVVEDPRTSSSDFNPTGYTPPLADRDLYSPINLKKNPRNAETQKLDKIVKKKRNSAIMPTHEEAQILEAAKREALKQKAIQKQRERREKRLALEDDNLADDLGGGRRRQQVRKTRKPKRRPRKTTQRAGRRKMTMKRKHRSRKNTRRRR